MRILGRLEICAESWFRNSGITGRLSPMRPARILIVEDEDIIRSSLREFLVDEGYQVAVAGSVVNGMIQAKRQDFDVAICGAARASRSLA